MSNDPSRIRHGIDAIQWLREHLNSGITLSRIALVEHNRVRLRAHRVIRNADKHRTFDHQAEINLSRAEFVQIDLTAPMPGVILSAAFEQEDRTTLELLFKNGKICIAFEEAQVSEQLVQVYVMNNS